MNFTSFLTSLLQQFSIYDIRLPTASLLFDAEFLSWYSSSLSEPKTLPTKVKCNFVKINSNKVYLQSVVTVNNMVEKGRKTVSSSPAEDPMSILNGTKRKYKTFCKTYLLSTHLLKKRMQFFT